MPDCLAPPNGARVADEEAVDPDALRREHRAEHFLSKDLRARRGRDHPAGCDRAGEAGPGQVRVRGQRFEPFVTDWEFREYAYHL